MRATLVYNAKAGTADSEKVVLEGLARLGWDVKRKLGRDDVDELLREEADVVVVAGGDGTVTKVAKRLAGTNVPMAVAPMGTANNVARGLGLALDAREAIAGLEHAVERRVDLGVVTHAGAQARFLEAFGVGVFAQILGERASKKTKKLPRALAMIADELESYTPSRWTIEIDGRDRSGAYLLVSVMNVRSVGPALEIAPCATCDDGELDVVLAPAAARESLLAYLRRTAADPCAAPRLESVRATQVRIIEPKGARWAHVDDAPCELEEAVTIGVAKGVVRVLTPELLHVGTT